MAASGTGFLTVFRSDVSNQQRVYAQRLDQNGAPVDAEPFLLSDQTDVDNPSVAWNGSAYLVVWDATGATAGVRQTFSRVVPTSGLPPTQTTPPTLVMNGHQPDVAGLDGTFLVTNILQETAQIRTVQSVRVDGTGTPLGTPVKIERLFDSWPRAAVFGNRWIVIWEGHNNHDDSPGTIRASFVAPDGTATAPFVVGDVGNDLKPEIAVAGDKALVVWDDLGQHLWPPPQRRRHLARTRERRGRRRRRRPAGRALGHMGRQTVRRRLDGQPPRTLSAAARRRRVRRAHRAHQRQDRRVRGRQLSSFPRRRPSSTPRTA